VAKKKKVGKRKKKSELEEMFIAGLVKSFLEPIAAQYVGNATMFSGAVKLAGTFAVNKFMGRDKLARVLSMALMIDGVEDIVYALRSGTIGGVEVQGGVI